jgi:hypothetical protein
MTAPVKGNKMVLVQAFFRLSPNIVSHLGKMSRDIFRKVMIFSAFFTAVSYRWHNKGLRRQGWEGASNNCQIFRYSLPALFAFSRQGSRLRRIHILKKEPA